EPQSYPTEAQIEGANIGNRGPARGRQLAQNQLFALLQGVEARTYGSVELLLGGVVWWFQPRARSVRLVLYRGREGLENLFHLGLQPPAAVPRDIVVRDGQQSFNLDVETFGRGDRGEQDCFALRIAELASGTVQ